MRLSVFLLGVIFLFSNISELFAQSRCATPDLSNSETVNLELKIKSFLNSKTRNLAANTSSPRPASSVTIPVWFHVINKGLGIEDGNISDDAIRQQITVLNDAYGGHTGGVATPFQFVLAGIDRTTKNIWFNIPIGSPVEKQVKTTLRRGGPETLNVYTGNLKRGGLGYATFPSQLERKPELDGVVIDFGTLPGGNLYRYDEGDTLTHEVGHWLGLFHTFQGSCGVAGDRVDDTPKERSPSYACSETRNTCGGPGRDPIHNFMDYSFDNCMFEFSAGQSLRMDQLSMQFRGL